MAVTVGAARPKIKMRWVQMSDMFLRSDMLLRCFGVATENCSGCWSEVEGGKRTGQICALNAI